MRLTKMRLLPTFKNEKGITEMKETTNSLYSPFICDKLRLSVTSACNANCFYCHNEGQGHFSDHDFLPPAFAASLANYLKETRFRIHKLNITGGEPLLHPHLKEILLSLKPYADKMRLNTNAVLLTDHKIDELLEWGVTSFKIGLDSVWNTVNDPIKAGTLEHIQHIIDYIGNRASVVINMVVSKFNEKYIDDMIDFASKSGAKRLKINELAAYNFRQSAIFDAAHSDAFQIAFNQYYKLCRHFESRKDLGMYDMELPNGFSLRWCADFCKARACGNMYTIINSRGECVVCPVSNETVKIDFSKSPDEITRLFLKLPEKSCGTAGQKYIRDINGNWINRDIITRWKWEKETNPYWKTPEECVYWFADRWKNAKADGILDLGAGLGRHSIFFAQHGYLVHALDLSDYAIRYIQKKKAEYGLPVVAVIGNMEQLPFEDESIGNVFAYNSISHTNQFGIREIFREVYRVLKPNGEFYFTICSKEDSAFSVDAVKLDRDTIIKQKIGPEYGVPHFYTDYAQLKILLGNFQIIKIDHIRSCYYDKSEHASCHYAVLARKI